MKKFDEFLNENVNLEWKDIFGKKYSHQATLKKNIKDGLVSILMDENNISEKNFKKIDDIYNEVGEKIDENIINQAEEHLQSGKRMTLFYELIYDKIYKSVNK